MPSMGPGYLSPQPFFCRCLRTPDTPRDTSPNSESSTSTSHSVCGEQGRRGEGDGWVDGWSNGDGWRDAMDRWMDRRLDGERARRALSQEQVVL